MEEKTTEEYYEELEEQYFNQDYEPATFLGNFDVPEGLTFWQAHCLYMKLMHNADDYDFFAVEEDSENEGNVIIINLLTNQCRSVSQDNIYPNRLKGEEWNDDFYNTI